MGLRISSIFLLCGAPYMVPGGCGEPGSRPAERRRTRVMMGWRPTMLHCSDGAGCQDADAVPPAGRQHAGACAAVVTGLARVPHGGRAEPAAGGLRRGRSGSRRGKSALSHARPAGSARQTWRGSLSMRCWAGPPAARRDEDRRKAVGEGRNVFQESVSISYYEIPYRNMKFILRQAKLAT